METIINWILFHRAANNYQGNGTSVFAVHVDMNVQNCRSNKCAEQRLRVAVYVVVLKMLAGITAAETAFGPQCSGDQLRPLFE